MTDEEFQAAVQQLSALVQEFETLPYPQIRERVFELLHYIDVVHREGLVRLINFLRDQGQAELVDQAARDSAIRTLLQLYDFAPQEELIQPAPAATATKHFISLDQVERETRRLAAHQPAFEDVASVEEVPAGTMKAVDVNGVHVLIASVEGEIYAVHNQCPGSMAPLHLGGFTPPIVTCPWHNEAYDVRTGERADGEETPKLRVVPTAVTDGMIQVAVDVLGEM